MSVRLLGYVYLALAMILVGSTVVASKLIASGLPVFTATALRFAIAFPCFLLMMRVTGTRLPGPGKYNKHDCIILLLQAGAGSLGYTTLLISGLHLTSAADAGVIIGTLPIVSAAIAIVLLGERPQRFLLLAVVLAGAGVLSIAFDGNANGHHSLTGNALILCAVICEGLFILLNKRLKTAIPPLALSTIMTGLGLALSIIPALFEMPWNTHISSDAMMVAAWATVYYALVPTVAGFLLWYAGAARVSGSEAALFTALAPVSAVMLAMVLLGEPVSRNQLIGIVCVLIAIGGMSLVGKPGNK
ncbi:DMT family transporter [Undibacterium sp. Ji49W]|uniref:DMT family transporter n=1 Tax=Undibacterium sp. Ji49W TaxID=3413040 RepID=UPI003BF309E3